jgi:hypothetical protein
MERWLASWPERAVQAWPGALGAASRPASG